MKDDGTKKLLMTIITLVFAGIFLFAVSFFIYHISKGKNADQIRFTFDELGSFELTDGKDGPLLVCETTLPDQIHDDTWVYYAASKDTKIFIDGKPRKEFGRNDNTIIGGTVKNVHLFTELFPDDAGKSIRIERDGAGYDPADMDKAYIGTSLGIIEHIIRLNIVFFILAISLALISLIAIVIGLLLRFYKKIVSPITSMGIGVFFVAVWLIFDSELYQLAFRQYFVDGTMSYIMMMLIPYPFVYYMDLLQEHRYRTAYASVMMVFEIISVCSFLIHFSGISDFLTMLPVLSLAEVVVIITIIATMIIDYMKGLHKLYFVSFIGVSGFILSCILEILFIFTVKGRKDGACLIAGLFFTITLAIIHQLYAVREAQKEAAVAVRASETKTNFLANMSHEIRTPMNAILGMDEMILREAKNNEKITRYATDIKSAGNMLLSIINDILDLSKIESGKMELIPTEFEICSVINDLINIVKRRADDKELEFIFDAAENIPIRFNGDEIRIRQIFLNIMNNAVKYTDKGSVRVNLDMKTDNAASADDIKAGDTVTLIMTVIDTGIGIREEDLGKLFQPFDRLEETKNRKIEGTGLGLNIANNYAILMGGHIDVESRYQEGSVFSAYLPVEVVDPTPIGDFSDRIKNRQSTGSEKKATVIAPGASALIVDDNEMNLEVISGLMERTRIKTDLALSGPEGIERMEHKRYDIVFLDQMMPQMDGITTLKEMHSRFDMRGVSVIALTADAVAGAKEYYLENGFDDYLSKPVNSDALEDTLKKHLPKTLILSREDIDRITEAEERKRTQELQPTASMVVIDPDTEALKDIKEKTAGLCKGTFVTDTEKASKYLKTHNADYVLIKKDLFVQINLDKQTDRMIYKSQTDEKE